MSAITIEALASASDIRADLSEILIAVVADGGSVSFMHPLAPADAEAFWSKALVAADRGDRIVLGARVGGLLVGTVTLLLDFPPNQPHRAEIAKLMTRPNARGLGIGAALMRAAEALAIDKGRTLLVLDTAADEGAAGFYEKLGFTRAGEIPDFALKPLGGLTATIIFWKRIGHVERVAAAPGRL